MVRRAVLAIAALAAVLGLAGCGGGETPSKGSATTTEAKGQVETADLRADESVPKGPADALGEAQITLDPKTGKARWQLSLDGVGKALSAHVHRGAAGRTGPVVIPLGPVNAPWGCVLAPAGVLRAVAAAPGGYYVNVHTGAFLDGAVRGQLQPA